jgi:hypothetical protein
MPERFSGRAQSTVQIRDTGNALSILSLHLPASRLSNYKKQEVSEITQM